MDVTIHRQTDRPTKDQSTRIFPDELRTHHRHRCASSPALPPGELLAILVDRPPVWKRREMDGLSLAIGQSSFDQPTIHPSNGQTGQTLENNVHLFELRLVVVDNGDSIGIIGDSGVPSTVSQPAELELEPNNSIFCS